MTQRATETGRGSATAMAIGWGGRWALLLLGSTLGGCAMDMATEQDTGNALGTDGPTYCYSGGNLTSERSFADAMNGSTVTIYYRLFLQREPDEAGLQFWTEQLTLCEMTETQVSEAFGTSPEYCTNMITDLYWMDFDREPDAAGLAFWVDQCTSGAMTLGEISTAFEHSPEYCARYQGYGYPWCS
jgi:uncharacterized protein DUF4214